jgi:hypothetical protein
MRRAGRNTDARLLVWLILWLFRAATGPTFTQARQTRDEAPPDSGVQLRVSTRSTTFYEGEVIPLDLAFSSTTPKRYFFNNASYDRSGRMNHEDFIVEPKEGTRDPLSLFFNSIGLHMAGGLSGGDFLSATPTHMHLNLNEWVSLERPGTYRLRIVSHRVTDHPTNDSPYSGEPLPVQSNSIELKIIAPDASWQAAQLAGIRQVLNSEVLNREPPTGSSATSELRQAALTRLRYLGTEEAAREMARRLGGEDNNGDFECMFGLIGSPHRSAGLEEMNRLFDNPDFPVSQLFLTTMAILPLDPAESRETLEAKREANRHALNERLMSALLHKRGKALAISLDAALDNGETKTPEGAQKRVIAELVGVFRALSPDQQATWLQYRWDAVKDPKWIALLRSIAQQYQDYSNDRETVAYQSLQVTGTALKRWYELDAEGARDAVMKEIVRPKPRYDASVLGILPDKTLPEVEQPLAQHFLATDDYDVEGKIASLIFRYADADVWPEVASKVTRNLETWACVSQDTMLAYALRVDPRIAETLIERAIAARGEAAGACRRGLFSEIGKLSTDPILEDLAIKSLADSDPSVAQDAANYLGSYGSADAEQPLWDRYEAWSKEWSGREKEMRYVYGGENPNAEQARLGESLARALASGVGWLADERKIRRIEQLGVGQTMSQLAENALRAWSQRPLVIVCMAIGIRSEPYRFDLAQYDLHSTEALKTKLRQFPRGTRFLWDSSNCGSSTEALNIFSEISQFATENGIVLQRAPAANAIDNLGEGSGG